MDFAEAFRVIRRRWQISVPVLLLTLVAVVGIWVAWPTTYQSTTQLSLISSSLLANQPINGHNAYVGTWSLNPIASILVSDLTSDQATQQLKALGMTNGFTAAVPTFAAGPFISLTVTGHSSTAVRDSMPVVIRFAQQRLHQLQETGSVHTAAPALIRAVVISPANRPQLSLKRKIELVAGVAIAGLLLLLLLSFGAEGRALRRAGNGEIPRGQRAADMVHPNGERKRAPDTKSSPQKAARVSGRSPRSMTKPSTGS